jgi:aspartyl-tRNA synthetase
MEQEFIQKDIVNSSMQVLTIKGWVHDFDKVKKSLIIRNYEGLTTFGVDENNEKLMDAFLEIGHEDAIEVLFFERIDIGNLKYCKELRILNRANKIPFTPHSRKKVSSSLRSKYRYLEFRDPEIFRVLQARHKFILGLSNYLDSIGFISIETPLLTMPTLTGAGEFLAKSSKNKELTYALAQSSQIYGQLAVAGGIERYYQFSKCFRDENLRANRQPEFTQLHIEMAFLNIDLLINIIEKVICNGAEAIDIKVEPHFPQMEFTEAMEIFETDKPDLRFDSVPELLPFVVDNINYKSDANKIILMKLPKVGIINKSDLDDLIGSANKCNFSFLGFSKRERVQTRKISSFKLHLDELSDFLSISSIPDDMDVTMWIGNFNEVNKLRKIHYQILTRYHIPHSERAFVWIRNIPLFEKENPKGPIKPANHPFVSPANELEFLNTSKHKDLIHLHSNSLDLVLNGEEIGSGSIVNHNENVQRKIFQVLGYKNADIQKHFGYLMESLKFGLPPIGGLGLGIDRILAIFLGFDTIRDVIAFPKTKQGYCTVIPPLKMINNNSSD